MLLPTQDSARCWAALGSLGAGLVHFGAVREHLDVSLQHGAFFLLVGTFQVCWALTALSRDRLPVRRLVLAVTAGTLLLWAVSRLLGLPGDGGPEPVGTADLLAAVMQLTVLAGVLAVDRLPATRPSSRLRRVAPLVLGALAMAAITTPALAATGAGDYARPHGGHGGGHAADPSHHHAEK